MVKLNRERVLSEALDLLDEVGLDSVSTRALARRLEVEQPSLYWHFSSKKELLGAMAEAAMAPHAMRELPSPPDDWQAWFLDNTRSFRRTLLARRDGARLHAGSHPRGIDLARGMQKLAFLVASGVPEHDAVMATLAASRFTVGSVLEEQADVAVIDAEAGEEESATSPPDHQSAFEAGLGLILAGLSSTTRQHP